MELIKPSCALSAYSNFVCPWIHQFNANVVLALHINQDPFPFMQTKIKATHKLNKEYVVRYDYITLL